MSNPNVNNRIGKDREYKVLAKNSFYSIVNNYGVYIFSTITSFLIARVISQVLWAYLIIAFSYITLISLISNFLPPSIGMAVNYYIPRYRSLNQNTKLRTFLLYSILLRFLFLIPIFLISITFFLVLNHLFTNLDGYVQLLFILSPLIIVIPSLGFLNDIVRSFNKFKIVFFLNTIRFLTYIIGLLILLFNRQIVRIELIGFILLLSYLIPSIINLLITVKIILNIKKSEEDKLTLVQVIKDLFKYGTHMSVRNFLHRFNREIKTQFISFVQPPATVTGYSIAFNYSYVSFEAVGSFNVPLTISFSSLTAKNKFKQIEKIYTNLFHYALFFILIITGVLYYVSDIFLFLIYTEFSASFPLYSIMMKLMVVAIIFNIQASFFYSLLRSSEKVKYIVPISLLTTIINISSFLIGLYSFGIIGGLIGLIIGNIIIYILLAFLSIKIFKIRLDIMKAILLYSSFFVSLGLASMLEVFALSKLNHLLLKSLNLLIFKDFQFLSFGVFIITFLFLIFILDVFSRSDIENLQSLFNRDNFTDKILRKSLKIIKRFMGKQQN